VAERWTDLGEAVMAKQRSAMLLLDLYGHAVAEPAMGALGRVALPAAAIELALPLVEAAGWLFLAVGLLLQWVEWDTAGIFVLMTLGLGLSVSLAALLLEIAAFDTLPGLSEKLRGVGLALLEQLGPRQFLLWWQLRAWLRSGSPAATA
jgi:hypothetical protein